MRFKEEGRRVYLCPTHYKMFKKSRRKLEKLEKWRLGLLSL